MNRVPCTALTAALLLAGCHNLAHRLPPYGEKVLAAGPATAIAAAPDGTWYVAGPGQAWTIAPDGATASWNLPWAATSGRGVQAVAQIAISATGRIAIADPRSSLVWGAGVAGQPATLSVLAGTGTGFYPIGDGDLAISAQISRPQGVAWDPEGDLFLSDTGHNRVRKVGTDGRIFTIAGRGFPEPLGDGGPAQEAGLWDPGALAAGKGGDVVVSDVGHDRTRAIASGVIRTLANAAAQGLTIDSQGVVFGTVGHEVDGWWDGDETVVARDLRSPAGIAANGQGQLAVADGDRVVLLTPR